jgi:2'-5' RNA ligase
METIRTFIAADLGEDIRRHLDELQRKLKKSHADVRWVKPRAMHLTLAFVGQTETDKVGALTAALDASLRLQPPFELQAHGTGTFGKPTHPRVIWAGISDNPALRETRQFVVEALKLADIPFDEKPFSPHLTLGRVKSAAHIPSLLQKLEKAQDADLGKTTVAEILLYQSVLARGGAEHTVLHRTPLTGGLRAP